MKTKTNQKRNFMICVAIVATLGMGVLTGCGSGGGGGNTTSNNGGNNGGLSVGSSLLPTKANYGWVYKDITRNRSYTIPYEGTATFNGQSAHKLGNSDGDPSYIAITGEGIASLGGGTDLDTNDWAVRFDLLPGQSKEFTATHTSGSLSGTERYRISRLPDETVTVPAGTFTCAVFQHTILEIGGSVSVGSVGDVDTNWYASGTGPVKFVSTSGSGTSSSTSTIVLESYGPIV
jgi:hypothetical protein